MNVPAVSRLEPRRIEERRLATVLFADLVGYTSVSERLDPEDVRTLQTLYFDRMSAEITRYEGTAEKYAGDAVLALFGVPLAHEDDPERAVRCAMNMLEALEPVKTFARQRWGIEIQLRVGVNTGEVVSGVWQIGERQEHSVSGDAVNVAARLQAAANPGEALVAEETMRLAQRSAEFGQPRELALKGRGGGVLAFPVTAVRHRAIERWEGSRASIPLVGREHELSVLQGYFRQVRNGEGRVVALTGEAGIGKSRLLLQLRLSLSDHGGRWVEGHCISYGKTIPYLPIIDLVRNIFRIDEGNNEQDIIDKVNSRVDGWQDAARGAAPYLKYLLNVDPGESSIIRMDPMERRAGVLDALHCLLVQESTAAPLVVVVEDLHWIDEQSEDVLNVLTDAVAHLPVFLLLTYRPGYSHVLHDRAHISRLAIDHLHPEESAHLACTMLGVTTLPKELERFITGKAEGNPFYVEEVTRSLIETGVLERRDGTCVLTRPIDDIYIPETIQEIILSRIDRLERSAKEAMQLASVIGREFTFRLLNRITDVEVSLDHVLVELKNLELIFERSYFPELAYMFKHALTHDVAYSTLLHDRRQSLHRVVANLVEELYADRLPDHYEVLAYHYSRGGVWDKAFEYMLLAAEKAAAAFANADALAYYDRALWIADHEREVPLSARIRIHAGKAGAAFPLNRWNDVAENWAQVGALAAQSGDGVTQGLALAGVAVGRIWTHEFSEADARASEALALGNELNNNAVRAGALYCLGFLDIVQGRLPQGESRLQESMRLSRETNQPMFEALAGVGVDLAQSWQAFYTASTLTAQHAAQTAEVHQIALPLLWARWTEGLALGGAGRYNEALQVLTATIDLCQRMGDVAMQSRAWNTLGWLHLDLGDVARATEDNRRALTLAGALGDPEIVVNAEVNLADCLLAQNDHAGARSELERLYRTLPQRHPWMKWRYSQHVMHSLGKVVLTMGEGDRALQLVDECVALATSTGSLKNVIKGQRLRAECFLAASRWEEAERAVQDALATARQVQNPSQLWQTLRVLGDIHAAQGRTDEARVAYSEAIALIEEVASSLSDETVRQSLLCADFTLALRERTQTVG